MLIPIDNIAMPTFSVIIPVYNAGAYIESSLASVFAQTCDDFEAIVVDDGSTDDTTARVNTFSHHAVLRYVYQANAGPAAARNTGIDLARGQFIAFLDADDLWHPRKLEAHLQRMQNAPHLGMSFNWFEVFYDRPQDDRLSPWFVPPSKPTLDWQDFLLRNWTGTSSTVVVRAECLKGQLRRFDARFRTGEDYQLWIEMAQAGWEIGFIPEVLTLYRKRPNSLTVDYLQIALDELLVMQQGVQITDETTAAIEMAITRRRMDVAWAYFRLGKKQMAMPFLKHGYQAIPQFLAERLKRKWLHRPSQPVCSHPLSRSL